MKNYKYILLLILFAWAGGYVCTRAYAQTDTIRYVRVSGNYSNHGSSWDDATNNLQNAINDLRDYLKDNHLTSGSVYVAAGTYRPTESTEASGGTMLNTSFKIYAGIHVYGGFDETNPESKPGDRMMVNGKKVSENWADQSGIGTTSGTEIASQWDLKNKTILSGNHTTTPPTFVFDSIRGRYNTAFPASSYHVVWFATNGKYETGNDSTDGHFKPLANPASLDGCVISSGSASTHNTLVREHTAYGGGVYMVGNSYMRACTIERCVATMQGGGIYMDGGGVAEFCLVHTCQATGEGVVQGYGGGVCIDYDGSIGHSHITNCAARCGGGLVITHISEEYPEALRDTVISNYSPYSTACVINNNTANAEGGGIYLVDGGTVNHATVCANNCIGPDVTYYGRRHGRTGGIYIRDCGMIFNSVFWGNRCAINNDIQLASVRQRVLSIPRAPSGEEADSAQQVFVYHSAFMNHDITDWTGATKERVFTLDKHNMPQQGSNGNYPCFFDPTVDPLDWNRVDTAGGKAMHGPGVFMHLKRLTDFPGPRVWHLTSYSAIDQKGVQVSEAVQNVSYWLKHAHTEYGVVSNPYEPSSTLGGLVRKPDPIHYSLIKPQGLESREGPNKDTPIPTLFVDPNRKGVYDKDTHEFVPQDIEGNSWDTPIRDLGEAVQYFRKYFVDGAGKRYYKMPKLDGDGKATGEDTIYRNIQILVKEGTLTTVGPGNYVEKNLRSAAIVTYGHMRFYGGYSSELDTTHTDGRNPRSYRTIINCNVTGEKGAVGYENNSAHVFALVNADSVIVDGFLLQDANTHNVYGGLASNDGGGLVMNNSTIADSLRIDMVGNQLRNCVINNCTSPRGAGVFINGEYPKKNGQICYAELKMVNTVIRNNTSADSYSSIVGNKGGVITANGRAFIYMDHCDVANNVGHALRAGNLRTASGGELPYRGYIRMDNSFLYCNSDTIRNDRVNIKFVQSVNKDGQDQVFGMYNMFDADVDAHKAAPHHEPLGFFNPGYTVPDPTIFLTGVPEAVADSFRARINGIPADSAARHNECLFTRTDVTDLHYPTFVNPSRNVGHSTTGDKPLYGGTVTYLPLNTNPIVNAANPGNRRPAENFDRSDEYTRDHGGAPDIGAIENTDLPPAGSVIYVTPNGAGKRDGSSWANAIAGNTVYRLNEVAGPDLATGDQIDPEETCDRVLDSGGNPILTTDEKYNGGWGRVYITDKTTGGTSTTTVTNIWTTEREVYSGGPQDGHVEILKNKVHSVDSTTVSNSTGTTPEGWSAGREYDPRYPYGEISGASRSFWRANPYHSGTDWNNASGYTDKQKDLFVSDCNANGWINNTRAERYVGGLQYAVEKASARNKTLHNDSVQVWVGAGHYTDYKGFVMRDSVTVYGGFPTNKYPAPGMSERQALMSAVIDIPKSLPAKDFNAADYETILQIDTINPDSTHLLKPRAVKYWDNDYKVEESTETRNYLYKTRVITDTYTYLPAHNDTNEVTSRYVLYPNMTSGSTSLSEPSQRQTTVINDTNYVQFGASVANFDYWHMSHPIKDHYVAFIENDNKTKNCTRKIYDPTLNKQLKGADATYQGNWIFVGNGSLTDLRLWQDMPNVPEGSYLLSVDAAGGYRNKYSSTENTKMYLRVYNANGTKCAESNIKTIGGTDNRDTNRGMAYRYVLSINQPQDGPLTIAIEVEDGVRNKGESYPKTSTGGDPDPIPAEYEENTGANNPNRREFWISNIHLKQIISVPEGYVPPTRRDTVINDTTVADPQGTTIVAAQYYTPTNERTTLRKRVLTMPDICVPTYGAGTVGDPSGDRGKFADGLAHTHRVKGPSKAKRTSWENKSYINEDPNYVEYQEANWDGFTIRHGFIVDENMAHGGGAGVNLYEGAHLRNCIIVNNSTYSGRIKGGGIYCDGATSTIEGCFALNNSACQGYTPRPDKEKDQVFAGGMFMYEGTCFNSLFANNFSNGSAGGLGFCVGQFFNNTIAYNTCDLKEDGQYSGGAISLAIASTPNLFVANTIIYGNNGIAIRDRNTAVGNVNPFLHCYIQSEVAHPYDATNKNVTNWTEANKNNYGIENIYLNGVAQSAVITPFAADFVNGVYTPGNASATNDFRLLNHAKTDSSCVNHGTEDFVGEFYTALRHKGKSDSEIKNSSVYKSVEQTVIPDNDVAFAKRVQDCQIDIGAYEYNAAYNIQPDTTTHPGHAIYYAMYESPGGDASARSPHDAACLQKLQLVLDAAGRYKYRLMTEHRYDTVTTIRAGWPSKDWTVEVRLTGDSTNSKITNDYGDHYTATRSTKQGTAGYHDNTLDYSFIVPHGVQLKGGYTKDFYHYENAEGTKVDAGTPGAHIVDERDPLTFRTVLSGHITSSTGAAGQTFHIVTFTNDLFDTDEKVKDDGNQLSIMTDEKDRAVLDGLFLMDGLANGADEEDRRGGGCVITDYAHVRNCVIQNNQAEANGGGLYLQPFALVSGCVIKNNTAETGGGIYVEAPASLNTDSLAHVFSSTICANTATSTAGGMWFDNSYVRVNSTALWQNNANDYANVSGSFTRSSADSDYPFNFCAVESRRLEGQANIELSPNETEGVRWDQTDPFNALMYYPIEMSSTLSRAGMTYSDWERARIKFPSLDTMDIAGVSRTHWTATGAKRGFAWGLDTLVTKSNDFIEIGARAINKNYAINVDEKYVLRRLYVMHSELINSEAARALQDNTKTDSISNMYRQMGSSILNPFHRLGDAFDYIIAARKSNPAKYRNTVFEVFIEAGTYYPYHNAYGEQDEVRNNTFLVPEGIYVIGGIDSQAEGHWYGQHGYYDLFTNDSIPAPHDTVNIPGTGYYIDVAPLDTIRLRDDRHRPMRDNNLNSVIEPWELARQTILSGNAVSGEDFTHVYHVITMHADSNYVGPQPRKYTQANPAYNKNNPHAAPMFLLEDALPFDDPDRFDEECDLSILGRTTEFDGIQITGGYANRLDPVDTMMHHYVTKTYFRGGGIFVDGNWTESFDDPGSEVPNVTEPAKYNIPIVVENCFFTNNMAGNGGGLYSNGAIYMYGCHFTQNYSQGPMTKLDQKFIPWTAGGCIATNAVCDVTNSLFANNEARRGLYPITISGDEYIPDADARQGFGGCLSVAAQSSMRVMNCHFMKNKAVAYSAIYNFKANNHYSNPDSMQFAFNTIFWGNEVFEVDNIGQLEHVDPPLEESIEAFNTKYKASRAGVFHYDGDVWDRYEKLYHEYDSIYAYWTNSDRGGSATPFHTDAINKLKELRQVGDSMEGLYFCSYRKTYGPTGMKPTSDGYLMTEEEHARYIDSRQTTVRLKYNANLDLVERVDSLFTYTHGNNNVLINRVNNMPDGPNFKQPSFVAGIDGYMQNADWLIARMNLTTDQGWGHLAQTVTRGIGYYLTRYTGKTHYRTYDLALAAANKAVGMDTCTAWSVLPVSGVPIASFNPVQPATQGIYNYYSARFGTFMSEVNAPLPLGDQYYMHYSRNVNDDGMGDNMRRISKNPKMEQTDVYIDIGMYEYQYVQLDLEGQEVDTVWVATKTKGQNQDGLTWETPTTDLQYAIELLMSSHNNSDKYVCFMGDSVQHFTPTKVIDNRRSFIVTSSTLAPLLPDSAEADVDYAIKSLNFLGGYSFDVKDAERDAHAHPTVIEMPNTGTQNQLNQLFIIEDMTHQLVQANWQGEYISRDSIVIPVRFDGITFINPYSIMDPEDDDLGGILSDKGGASIYYRWQRYYDSSQGSTTPDIRSALGPDSIIVDGHKIAMPKLTITNCTFMDNGDRTVGKARRSPAVRIDHGGGSSLIVNSLFHSNAGDPIYAQRHENIEGDNNLARIPNDVVIVNSTFALNGGHLTLEAEGSQIHNSLIWLDDLNNDTTTQLEIHETKWDKGSSTLGSDSVSNNAVWRCFVAGDATYKNDSLVTENRDINKGPGFLEPFVTAATSAERRERSFRINPSLLTYSKADSTVYRTHVMYRSPKLDLDLASKPRYFGDGMDRGAYECLAALQRVIYVQPNRPSVSAGDGSSWEQALGQGQLQDAIDMAAVYTYIKSASNRETQKAYVFVKGSGEDNTVMNIMARDGVNVYGSLPSSFSDTVYLNPDSAAFTNAECQRYVNYIRALSTGVASPSATPTRINSIHAGSNNFTVGFLMDGFVITNPNTTLTESPIQLNNDYTALRNCLITDNKVTGGAPVADIHKGLLYNSLFYADSAASLVKVGDGGFALNNTIVTDNEAIAPFDSAAAADGAVLNNIACRIDTAKCFAPYQKAGNPYTLPAYLTANASLVYQLHEHSAYINAGTEALTAFSEFTADNTINFSRDRDILGNPRKISTSVDIGALETWRIEPKSAVEITARTNRVMGDYVTYASVEVLRSAFTNNYGGNKYPHPGSVVYLMDSSALSMHTDLEGDFKDFQNQPIFLRPGYMLLKSGSSFYGNGNDVLMNYLAVEKRFKNQRYSMTAFPFKYDTANIVFTTYNSTTDTLELKHSPLPFKTYQYSGAARSAKDYNFQTENSSLWLPVDTATRTATEGYLMDFGRTVVDTVLRFTSFAPVSGQYVYTETGEYEKIVELHQYDHREAGTGSELNFTRQEDMGWNMKGIPWLVSNYRTDTAVDGYEYMRQMYIPHVLYMMNGAGIYEKLSEEVIYSARSWDKGTYISMGNAFFTQTATTKEKENLYFQLPYYAKNERPLKPLLAFHGDRGSSADILTIIPDENASKTVNYAYGRDAIKWASADQSVQMYMLDSKRLNRLSLLAAAPLEVDIPLGLKVPAEMKYTFSLPEREAFDGYEYVWLIDYDRNHYINLLFEDYEVDLEPGEYNNRFAVRIGGFPKTDADGKRQYVIFAHDGTLHVRGLVPGDRISIYSPLGQLIQTGIASHSEWTTFLHYQSGYVVKVNDVAQKVLNQ